MFRSIPIVILVLSASTLQANSLPEDISLVSAFDGQSFSFPVAVRHAGDDSGRRFVVERAGLVRIVDGQDNLLEPPFLDLTHIVDTTGEGGLLGLAFHPDYADNGRFFVNYTYDGNAGSATELITSIAEFTVDPGDANLADDASERIILEVPQDANNHNGGDLHFGPDGHLWIALGDGGSGNDPCDRAQTLDPDELADCGNHPTTPAKALLGKMVRIDIDRTTESGSNSLCGANEDGSAHYAIPADSTFVVALLRDRFQDPPPTAGITEGACAETWSYGLRNPYRFSFDRATGDVWIADVGQNTWEEINFTLAGSTGGENYGWRICEGNWARGSTTQPCPLDPHAAPVIEYRTGPDDNCAVTGGYRYRGPVASLTGYYVYGDFCSGRIWFASEDGNGGWEAEEFTVLNPDGFGGLVGFGEDEAGELYLTRGNGEILLFDGDRN